jgi:predicted lipid-binding transport protein (Tim44 family)
VPSPDTDELATVPVPVPQPAGAPEAERVSEPETVPQRVSEAETAPQERAEPERISEAPEATAAPAKDGGRWWRGFTGSLAAGLVVLAVGVLVVAGVCLVSGAPGPGPVLLVGHPVVAALAWTAQRVVDRRNGAPAAGAGIAVVLFAVSALTLFWLT